MDMYSDIAQVRIVLKLYLNCFPVLYINASIERTREDNNANVINANIETTTIFNVYFV